MLSSALDGMFQKAEHLEQGPLKASRLEKKIFWKENPHFAAKLGLILGDST
jgi:hypothetical protein